MNAINKLSFLAYKHNKILYEPNMAQWQENWAIVGFDSSLSHILHKAFFQVSANS